MGDLNVIDQFTQTFIRFIDSGFGLLNGDVAALTTVLVGIDITLAGLFWALDSDANVISRLLMKVLYVGAFAFILNNFSNLSTIIFNSFSTLGIDATGAKLTAQDLLHPGKFAGIGYQAAFPLLQAVGQFSGLITIAKNFVTIAVLLFAWLVVILSFFVLAVQLFITIIEFKLTTLAGFVLVPFALWNKTAFLAERVLGNVVSSGIKVMVLAVIVGIGSTLFGVFTAQTGGQAPTLAQAASLVLASITLFGLGTFGPGIAAGLVSGAPQLGAGAAIGTVGALIGATLLAGGAAAGAGRLLGRGSISAVRAGTSLGAGTATAFQMGRATSGAGGLTGVGASVGGVARAGAGAMRHSARSVIPRATDALSASAASGRQAAWRATGGRSPAASTGAGGAGANAASDDVAPAWARRLRAAQRRQRHVHAVTQAIKDGDRPGAGANPDLGEEN
ncbi:MAG TPA: P-type conjugative transfer protein TrbL [Stellaceae bacterium]|nr:P-type conjugative transfer protein TrbL [Stellaceae bacterium]